MSNAVGSSAETGENSFSNKMIFWASFFTLIAAGIGFSVRGEILNDWGSQFGFTQAELGTITGGGLIGFGVTIIVLSFIADWIGYGRLMILAFLLHASSAVVTLAATPVYGAYGKEGAFLCLNIGMWLFALGNGTCEAVINPLTATLFPKNKTHWLNILHAGWPGGLILGALIALVFNQFEGIRWELKYGVFVIPVLLYGLMMLGRKFPQSEARVQGVKIGEMMSDVGMLGTAVAVFFIGFLLSSQIVPSIPGLEKNGWIGWIIALGIWIGYGAMTKFSVGHFVLAILYMLHALVGYVELGTDSWIINIGNTVLNNKTYALLAFIWTNFLMFSLRFFAGPIVHKISPLGLLFASAVIGTIGLVLFSQSFVDGFILWFVVSTIYAIGKTFYWPTLLGVISERFPKGGALALGLSGGIGMLSAGLLGGPGIGYKQDRFAVQKVEPHADTFNHYVSRGETGEVKKSGFPLLSDIGLVDKVAGLDNSKLKVMDDHTKVLADSAQGKQSKTTLQSDLDTMEKVKAGGGKVETKLEESLTGLDRWWKTEGLPNYAMDKPRLGEARLHGARQAMLYTGAVPTLMAIGFLLLVIIFKMQGGYKQVHIGGGH
jgi:MFS family permease